MVASATKFTENVRSAVICCFLQSLGLSAVKWYKIRTQPLPVSAPAAFEVTFSKLQARVV